MSESVKSISKTVKLNKDLPPAPSISCAGGAVRGADLKGGASGSLAIVCARHLLNYSGISARAWVQGAFLHGLLVLSRIRTNKI